MRVYIFGEGHTGAPDWYYTAHKLHAPKRLRKTGGGSVLVLVAEPVQPGGVGYLLGLRAFAAGIRAHNLFFRKSKAEAEAERRRAERFGG